MPAATTHTTALGICPETFWAEQQFNLVPVAAELHDGRWMRIGNVTAKYQPEGRFYVYRDFCHGLRPHEIAAWEVEDVPNWADQNYKTRFRAVRRAEPPLEIISVNVESTAPNVREYLTTVGVEAKVGRADGIALVEFADGVVAKIKLEPHPSAHGWSVAARSVAVATDLHNPIDAWTSAKEFQVLTFNPNGKPRRFVVNTDLGHAPEALDLATWEEILQTATRAGGLGSYTGPPFAELRKAREKLQEVLKTFPPGKWDARRRRVEQLLKDTDQAAAAREDLTAYVASHPAFHRAVDSRAAEKAEELRATLRDEVRAAEAEVVSRISQKEAEFNAVDQSVRRAEEELARMTKEIEDLRQSRSKLDAEIDALRKERDTPGRPEATPPTRPTPGWLAAGSEVTVSTPGAAVALIEKNLVALGVNGLMARNVAYETVAAVSIGQVTFFRGSLARPVAEAVGISVGGGAFRIERVTVGSSDTPWLGVDGSRGLRAVLLAGANLACLDTYGENLKSVVFRRRVSPSCPRMPVILATLEDGPGALPPHVGFCDLGPVLDTDVLRWNPPSKEPALVRGALEPTALQVPDGEFDREAWDPIIKDTARSPGGLWPGIAASVVRRLAGLSPAAKGTHPAASFLFGWLVPRLLASGAAIADAEEAIRGALALAPEPRDPRLLAVLAAHGLEIGK